MRQEKKLLAAAARKQIEKAPFALLVDFTKLNVAQTTELRKRLRAASAEFHVVKNSALRAACKECGIEGLDAVYAGPTAVITGQKDVSTTAKVLKTFASEFDKPKLKLGLMDRLVLTPAQIIELAELPSLEELRAKLLGLLIAPQGQLVRLMAAPASKFVQIIKAYEDKKGKEDPAAEAAPAAEPAKA
ncbi:MAG: 50S ribosomal protein L10 [Verrucomicrobia bacterium]|nr:50S ribosomal protein L10 [Verrucomicrobiota bacterium]